MSWELLHSTCLKKLVSFILEKQFPECVVSVPQGEVLPRTEAAHFRRVFSFHGFCDKVPERTTEWRVTLAASQVSDHSRLLHLLPSLCVPRRNIPQSVVECLALGGEETGRTERPGGRGIERDETGREADGYQGQNPLDTRLQ